MFHQLYQVVDFDILHDYVIWIRFNDDAEQVIDFEPMLHGEIWGPLRDKDMFNQVMIDPIARTLCWPTGADFDPETLRHWPIYQDELVMRARQWDAVLA